MRAQARDHEIPLDRAVDLEALDSFLMSDRSPSDSMMLSDLDGFLTGIAIGPELVLPSEWLPLIWGGDAPEFADEDEAKAILGAIMGRYNEIIRLNCGRHVRANLLGRSRRHAHRGRLGRRVLAGDHAARGRMGQPVQIEARRSASVPDSRTLRRRERRVSARPAAGRRRSHHGRGDRVHSRMRHRDRRLLARKRIDANLDAVDARSTLSTPPTVNQDRPQ